MLGDLLDSGEIDYAILDALEGFLYKVKPLRALTMETEYSQQEFMKNNIIRAMLDLNIIFKSKYYNDMTLEHQLYFIALEKYVKEKREAMNPYENWSYKLFKKVKGLKFGSSYSGVPL